jgi:hypothetical protein
VLREFDAWQVAFPTATRTTAFLSEASLAALAILLDVLKSCGVSPYNADSPEMFPFIAIYFFVTAILLVIGPRNLFPAGLKTRIPLVYFPIDRAGWALLFNCWGRMLAWFLGAAAVVALMSLARLLLR